MKKEIFAAGRVELAGNHTDHQNGRVLGSATARGIHAQAQPNGEDRIRLRSRGYGEIEVKPSQLAVRTQEFGTPQAMLRGVLAAFQELGLEIGGFDATLRTTLPTGAGLSSSAAFAVLMGRILNHLFNNDEIEPIVLARAAQSAENRYFGKPCGLMDQLACSLGHTVYVDFRTNEIEPIVADFGAMDLTLCLTDTGGSHAGLDTSYARIPADMVYVANLFDKGVLGDVDPADFYARGYSESDRPIRRAMHFFGENERVPKMRDALKRGDGESYMKLMNESGRSSEQLLNNIVTSATGDTKLAEGLEKSAQLLDGRGAWRVHGGGFAGCVQALMPCDYFETYRSAMEKAFGPGPCREIRLA